MAGRPKKISNEDLMRQMDDNDTQRRKLSVPIDEKVISNEDFELELDKLASLWKEGKWEYTEENGNKGIMLFTHRYFRHPASGKWTKSKVKDDVGELSPVDREIWVTLSQNNASTLEFARRFFTNPS